MNSSIGHAGGISINYIYILLGLTVVVTAIFLYDKLKEQKTNEWLENYKQI